jgi:hypothetical protein
VAVDPPLPKRKTKAHTAKSIRNRDGLTHRLYCLVLNVYIYSFCKQASKVVRYETYPPHGASGGGAPFSFPDPVSVWTQSIWRRMRPSWSRCGVRAAFDNVLSTAAASSVEALTLPTRRPRSDPDVTRHDDLLASEINRRTPDLYLHLKRVGSLHLHSDCRLQSVLVGFNVTVGQRWLLGRV